MNIKTSIVNPFLYTFCLIVCLGFNLYGQQQSDPALNFVDSLNQIINSKPEWSKTRAAASKELRERLVKVLRKGSFEQRYFVAGQVEELDKKMSTYQDLTQQHTKTMNNEIMLLEIQFEKLKDSISQIQQALKKIIEDDEQNKVNREKAVFALARIHDTKVLDYLFENEEKLRFTEIDYNSSNYDAEVNEMNRTAMVAISNEYFYKENTKSEKWLLFNYLLHDLKQDGFMEFVLVNYLLTQPERFKSQELFLEFMYANSSPGSYKTLESFIPNKNKQKN